MAHGARERPRATVLAWRAMARDAPARDGTAAGEAAARVLRGGVVLAIVAVAIQSVAHLVDVRAYDLSVDFINVDSDTSAFAWAGATATAACGVLVAVLAAVRGRAVGLLALAGALLFLSLDDALAIHERVGEYETEIAGLDHASRLFWPIVYMPLLGAVFVGLWLLARRMERWAGLLLQAGLACLAGAIALEMASPLLFELGFGHGSAPYELEAIAEEGLELAGWIFAATAVAATLVLSAAVATPDASPAEE